MLGIDKYDLSEANDCVFCGHRPKVDHYSTSMWYITCSNPKCEKHDPYAYLGSTLKGSIEQWNYVNRNICRISTKKRKKRADSNSQPTDA